MGRLTTEEFISRAKLKHGDRYDYSKTEYQLTNRDVIIICKDHGEFLQKPTYHLNSYGCLMCSKINVKKDKTKSQEKILKEFNSVHRGGYDYSLVEYVHDKQKVKIICKKHGKFEQTPNSHRQGKGCIQCGFDSNKKNQSKTLSNFIKDAIKVHGDRYCYDYSKYINTHTKIDIECKKHGSFKQTPHQHLSGGGCYKCGRESIVKATREHPRGWGPTNWGSCASISKNFDSFKVYVIKCWNDNESFYKIGRTYRKTDNRFKKSGIPYNYGIVKEFIFETAKEAYDYENKLKREYKLFKYTPLLEFSGKSECFTDYYSPCSGWPLNPSLVF